MSSQLITVQHKTHIAYCSYILSQITDKNKITSIAKVHQVSSHFITVLEMLTQKPQQVEITK